MDPVRVYLVGSGHQSRSDGFSGYLFPDPTGSTSPFARSRRTRVPPPHAGATPRKRENDGHSPFRPFCRSGPGDPEPSRFPNRRSIRRIIPGPRRAIGRLTSRKYLRTLSPAPGSPVLLFRVSGNSSQTPLRKCRSGVSPTRGVPRNTKELPSDGPVRPV